MTLGLQGTVRVSNAVIEGQTVLLKFESPLKYLDDNTCLADWAPLRGTAAAHFVSVTHPKPPYYRSHNRSSLNESPAMRPVEVVAAYMVACSFALKGQTAPRKPNMRDIVCR